MKEKRVLKYKSSPNLEYTCKTEVNTTMCNSIYSSTRTVNKCKKNDRCIMNDQTDIHSLCSCKNYYKTFLNDEIRDK